MPLELEERGQGEVSIAHASRIIHHEKDNLEAIERILAVPALSASWREAFKKLLARCREGRRGA